LNGLARHDELSDVLNAALERHQDGTRLSHERANTRLNLSRQSNNSSEESENLSGAIDDLIRATEGGESGQASGV